MAEHDANHHGIQVPRGALIGAAVLIGLTMAAVAIVRFTGMDPTAQVPAPTALVTDRTLRFEDQPNGSVVVLQVSADGSERVVKVLESGADGFIRGVLRSLARARRTAGIGKEQPFVLSMQADGRVVLEDPATRQRIDLRAFGPTNVESFRKLLIEEDNES